jgi:hypothetical protein
MTRRLTRHALLWLLPAVLAVAPVAAQTLRAVGVLDSGTGSITPALPTGHAAGDINILLTGGQGNTVDLDLSGSGWTQLGTSTGEGTLTLQTWCRLEQGGDAAPSYDWEGTGTAYGQILGFHSMGFTDCSTILDQYAHDGDQSASIPSPGVTPTQDNEIVIAFGMKQQDGTPTDPGDIGCPTGGSFTEDGEISLNVAFTPHWIACHLIQTTATAVTASSFTATGSFEASNTVRETLAIKGGSISGGGFSAVRGPTRLPGSVQ